MHENCFIQHSGRQKSGRLNKGLTSISTRTGLNFVVTKTLEKDGHQWQELVFGRNGLPTTGLRTHLFTLACA